MDKTEARCRQILHFGGEYRQNLTTLVCEVLKPGSLATGRIQRLGMVQVKDF